MTKINLRIPIIVMVLAAIAVPIELRSLGHATIGFDFDALDFFENIAGFIPVGIVLGEFGLLRGVILAALMSIFSETGQLVMMHRDPSVMDVVANTMGAILGAGIARHWQIHSLSLERDELMARYGSTPLALNTWYHVAGVYDADARTLDVYLNGKLDNGFLLGSVTGSQHSSGNDVFVGRLGDSKQFEFAGLIDECISIHSS